MSPLVCIIFGATGDLMSRKLMPALASLYQHNHLSDHIHIVGIGRRAIDSAEFQHMMEESLSRSPLSQTFVQTPMWQTLKSQLSYVSGTFEDASLYEQLAKQLQSYDQEAGACMARLFYLATPPEHYETILSHLKTSDLAHGCGQNTAKFTKVLIEKPFGKNLETAKKLDQLLGTIFEEKQIYRIDHYLAKETIQNMLAFRFANGMFEPTWNHEFIDHVQITVSETVGVETRGNFYEGIGALRDVVQNHILQMVSLIAMEQPRAFDAQSIRDERTAVISSIVPFTPETIATRVIRGQYVGYTEEMGVEKTSTTETFVSMKLFIDTPRWQNVPFYIRTGKKLAEKKTEVSIHFKKPRLCDDEVCLFNPDHVFRNVLSLTIDPQESVSLRLMVKKPGIGMTLAPAFMQFTYASQLPNDVHLDAYERLLLDAIAGDQIHFARTDEIAASWQAVSPILDAWQQHAVPLFSYQAGSLGPNESDALIQHDGKTWYLYQK